MSMTRTQLKTKSCSCSSKKKSDAKNRVSRRESKKVSKTSNPLIKFGKLYWSQLRREHLYFLIKLVFSNPRAYASALVVGLIVLLQCCLLLLTRNLAIHLVGWTSIFLVIAYNVKKTRPFQLKHTISAPPNARCLGSKWMNKPLDTTEQQQSIIRYLSSITWQVDSKEELRKFWNQKGFLGQEVHALGDQIHFTSIRYHLAFTTYSLALQQCKIPAYTGNFRRSFKVLFELMLEYRVWHYMKRYWGKQAKPFHCDENIMYHAHILQMAALYEALTGDAIYRTQGFNAVGANGEVVDHSTTVEVADELVRGMSLTKSGGMACSPNLIFFQCQNHAHIGFKILENLNLGLDYSAPRDKWENFALKNLKAKIGTGAFAILFSNIGTITTPMGHLESDILYSLLSCQVRQSIEFSIGSDGWSLAYYFPWSKHLRTPVSIWYEETKPILDTFDTLDSEPEVFTEHGEASCCMPMNIPSNAWVASLVAVAGQAGDVATVDKMASWLDRYYLETTSVNERQRSRLKEGMEYSIGNTASYLMGLVTRDDPELFRNLIDHPLTPEYFAKPYVYDIVPNETDVYRCYREELIANTKFVLKCRVLLPLNVNEVTFYLKNVRTVVGVSCKTVSWKFDAHSAQLILGDCCKNQAFDIDITVTM